jgi:hypothetical protein
VEATAYNKYRIEFVLHFFILEEKQIKKPEFEPLDSSPNTFLKTDKNHCS